VLCGPPTLRGVTLSWGPLQTLSANPGHGSIKYTIVISALRVRRLALRRVLSLAQGPTIRQWQGETGRQAWLGSKCPSLPGLISLHSWKAALL
jgi:hypothetical protein